MSEEAPQEQEAALLPPTSAAELVQQELEPQVVTDDQGNPRYLYHSNSAGATVAFLLRSVYERPAYRGQNVEDIGSPPMPGIFTGQTHLAYVASLKLPHTIGGETNLFQTTRDLGGFVELARRLAPGASLPTNPAADSPQTRSLYEQITATLLISDEGEPNTQLFPHAEALVLLALQGNADARRLVDSKVDRLREIDEQKLRTTLAADREHLSDVEPRDISHDCLVHLQSQPPQRDSKGRPLFSADAFSVTRPDGTPERVVYPAASVHFALNGPVAPNEIRSWQDADVAVIALAEPNVTNKQFTNIGAGDTIARLYPGEQLPLEEAWVVMPADDSHPLPPSGLYQVDESNRTIYYAKNVGQLHLRDLGELELPQQFRNTTLRDPSIIQRIVAASTSSTTYEPGARQFTDFVPMHSELPNILRQSLQRDGDLDTIVRNGLLEALQVRDTGLSPDDCHRLADTYANTVVMRAIHMLVRDFAVGEAIRRLDANYERPMGEGWQDERDAGLARYAVDLGKPPLADARSAEGALKTAAASAFEVASHPEMLHLFRAPSWSTARSSANSEDNHTDPVNTAPSDGTFKWEYYRPRITPYLLIRAAAQLRAAVYGAGLLDSRV